VAQRDPLQRHLPRPGPGGSSLARRARPAFQHLDAVTGVIPAQQQRHLRRRRSVGRSGRTILDQHAVTGPRLHLHLHPFRGAIREAVQIDVALLLLRAQHTPQPRLLHGEQLNLVLGTGGPPAQLRGGPTVQGAFAVQQRQAIAACGVVHALRFALLLAGRARKTQR
jgi:hypothetical protein